MSLLPKLVKQVFDHCLQLTCEACNKDFECGARLNGCWCADIKLSETVRAKLSATYSKCLCPECLKSYETASIANGKTNEQVSSGAKN